MKATNSVSRVIKVVNSRWIVDRFASRLVYFLFLFIFIYLFIAPPPNRNGVQITVFVKCVGKNSIDKGRMRSGLAKCQKCFI